MIGDSRVFVHNFKEANNPDSRYWRDIGTLDAYWAANMDLCSEFPQCNMYDPAWPIRTYQEQVPPARTVNLPPKCGGSEGQVFNSLISGGCLIAGSTSQSVLSPNVRIGTGSHVDASVLLDGVQVGKNVNMRKAIVDQEAVIPDDFTVGFDEEQDRARFAISPNGVVIVPRGMSLT
jgi:glucose-1-phosphate adenylyltransferase